MRVLYRITYWSNRTLYYIIEVEGLVLHSPWVYSQLQYVLSINEHNKMKKKKLFPFLLQLIPFQFTIPFLLQLIMFQFLIFVKRKLLPLSLVKGEGLHYLPTHRPSRSQCPCLTIETKGIMMISLIIL